MTRTTIETLGTAYDRGELTYAQYAALMGQRPDDGDFELDLTGE